MGTPKRKKRVNMMKKRANMMKKIMRKVNSGKHVAATNATRMLNGTHAGKIVKSAYMKTKTTKKRKKKKMRKKRTKRRKRKKREVNMRNGQNGAKKVKIMRRMNRMKCVPLNVIVDEEIGHAGIGVMNACGMRNKVNKRMVKNTTTGKTIAKMTRKTMANTTGKTITNTTGKTIMKTTGKTIM